MCMVTKTITITEKAYQLLARNKLPNESFSQEITREFGIKTRSILEFAGIMSDLTKEQWNQFEEAIREGREQSKKRRERILKELSE